MSTRQGEGTQGLHESLLSGRFAPSGNQSAEDFRQAWAGLLHPGYPIPPQRNLSHETLATGGGSRADLLGPDTDPGMRQDQTRDDASVIGSVDWSEGDDEAETGWVEELGGLDTFVQVRDQRWVDMVQRAAEEQERQERPPRMARRNEEQPRRTNNPPSSSSGRNRWAFWRRR